MDTYSILLLVALIATGACLVVTVGWSGRRAVARVTALLGIVLGGLALAAHVPLGHRPGTAQALRPLAFIGEHPTLIGVLIVAVALLVVNREGRRNRD